MNRKMSDWRNELGLFSTAFVRTLIGFLIVIVSAVAFSASLNIADRSKAVNEACPSPLQTCVDTSMPTQNGKIFAVNTDAEFTQALAQSVLGDTIVLTAGKIFNGPFTLPKKSGTGWIVITTSQASSLPPQGTRVDPSKITFPKIITDDTQPAIKAANGAHHYRFVGVEIASQYAITTGTVMNLVLLGDGNQLEPDLPHHIIFDRSYIHGNPTGNLRRGITMNGQHMAAVDSYISEAHEVGADAQGIAGWSGNGPFKIVNNYIQGAGENVIFGGAMPKPGLNPSDLEFRRNYLMKPLSWRGGKWTIKNIFELKDMRRAVIDSNIFENNWSAAQTGTAILFTPTSQSGDDAAVNDLVFSNNIIRHASGGVQFVGTDYHDARYPNQGVQTSRIVIRNNSFEDISASNWGGLGRYVLMTSGPGPNQITFDHNSADQSGAGLYLDGTPDGVQGLVFTNNVFNGTTYGVFGSGKSPGTVSLEAFLAPGYVFSKNALIGANPKLYPQDNYFPTTNLVSGLVGTDGKPVGADMNALNIAIAGVMEGQPSTTPPPPVNNPASQVSNPAPPSSGSSSTGGRSLPTPDQQENNPPSVAPYPDGTLLYDGGAIYVMEYGRKRAFVSMPVFSGLGYKLSNIINVNTSGILEGPGIFTAEVRHPRGSLINDNGAVYFVGSSLRYGFPSAEIFYSWGNKFQNVVPSNSYDLQISKGPIVGMK